MFKLDSYYITASVLTRFIQANEVQHFHVTPPCTLQINICDTDNGLCPQNVTFHRHIYFNLSDLVELLPTHVPSNFVAEHKVKHSKQVCKWVISIPRTIGGSVHVHSSVNLMSCYSY